MKLAAVALLLAAAAVRAAGLEVLPSRVDVSAERRVAVVTLVNTGVEPLTLRAGAVRWPSLPRAVAPDTAPLHIEPAALTIAPGRRQTVRVTLLDRGPPGVERRYRVVFTATPPVRDLADVGPASALVARAALPVRAVAPGTPLPVQWQVASSAIKPVANAVPRDAIRKRKVVSRSSRTAKARAAERRAANALKDREAPRSLDS